MDDIYITTYLITLLLGVVITTGLRVPPLLSGFVKVVVNTKESVYSDFSIYSQIVNLARPERPSNPVPFGHWVGG